MSTVDFGFWLTLAAGIGIGIIWERRDALADWLASWLDDEPVRRELPQSHPAVRVLRAPYDYERDA